MAEDPDENQTLSFQVDSGDGYNDRDNGKYYIKNDSLFIDEHVNYNEQKV